MISASYAGCDHLLVIFFFIISVGARGFLTAGLYVNPMDLSPNYAAAIMSVANGIGAFTGILAPYIVGLLTPNVGAIFLFFLTDIVYLKNCLFSSHSYLNGAWYFGLRLLLTFRK